MFTIVLRLIFGAAARAAETSPRRVQDGRPPPLSGVAEAAEAARGEPEAGTPAGA